MLPLSASNDFPRPGRSVAAILTAKWARPVLARESAGLVRGALRAAGDEAVVIRAGVHLAEELAQHRPDFVIPCATGDLTEGGILEDALELLDVPYLGSEATVTRVAADKVLTKSVLSRAGLPVPPGRIVGRRASLEWGRAAVARVESDLGLPVVVKPVHGSGGLGVKLAVCAEDVARVVTGALLYAPEAVIEPFVPGQELSIVLTGVEARPRVLGVALVEPVDPGRHAVSGGLRGFRPAGDIAGRASIVRLAEQAFVALGCRDFAVVDVIVDVDGKPWILEVDTSLALVGLGTFGAAAVDGGMTVEEAVLRVCARCRRTSRASSVAA